MIMVKIEIDRRVAVTPYNRICPLPGFVCQVSWFARIRRFCDLEYAVAWRLVDVVECLSIAKRRGWGGVWDNRCAWRAGDNAFQIFDQIFGAQSRPVATTVPPGAIRQLEH
ncbi:hypothetical protein [Burkholderia gladioli]|uniref:hypothetical protein n=1 Tax=Burkholderia gladioli TaxID=28095 RepID=UPI0016403464|nr:hypothetical protein [Burkholderia gladioli]